MHAIKHARIRIQSSSIPSVKFVALWAQAILAQDASVVLRLGTRGGPPRGGHAAPALTGTMATASTTTFSSASLVSRVGFLCRRARSQQRTWHEHGRKPLFWLLCLLRWPLGRLPPVAWLAPLSCRRLRRRGRVPLGPLLRGVRSPRRRRAQGRPGPRRGKRFLPLGRGRSAGRGALKKPPLKKKTRAEPGMGSQRVQVVGPEMMATAGVDLARWLGTGRMAQAAAQSGARPEVQVGLARSSAARRVFDGGKDQGHCARCKVCRAETRKRGASKGPKGRPGPNKPDCNNRFGR